MVARSRASVRTALPAAASIATSSIASSSVPSSSTLPVANDIDTSAAEEGTKRKRGSRALFAPTPIAKLEDGIKQEKEEEGAVYRVLRRSTRASTSAATAVQAAEAEGRGLKGEIEEQSDQDEDKKPRSPTKKVKKETKDPFSTSPRKAPSKPIKLELEAHEARPAPKRWREQLAILTEQRRRILAPVDTMGCEENGRDDRRGDKDRVQSGTESEEDKAKRERFTILISLMLSSQTKDPVTAEAVRNLQTRLEGGLTLESLLAAPQDLISSCIAKVGFWRRKTGYITSAAQILKDDFSGDVPKTIDELCSLPGVGPKMSFLALQSAWGLNVGIGVDVHVHRLSNRLKWVNSQDPEGTRLQLQSWLPKELHSTINKTLVGFGQVVCQPVGPRCDLCSLGAARMCPSYRKVDPKSVLKRVKVEFLPEGSEHPSDKRVKTEAAAAAVKIEGPDGSGMLLDDAKDAVQAAVAADAGQIIKDTTIAVKKEEGLDW